MKAKWKKADIYELLELFDYFISADKHHLKKKLGDVLRDLGVEAVPLSGISFIKF